MPEDGDWQHWNTLTVSTQLALDHYTDVEVAVHEQVLFVRRGVMQLGMYSPPWKAGL